MREDLHDIQTPKKELLTSLNRKGKSINPHSKKPNRPQQKSIKKNLSSVFTPITEDEVESNLSEESIEKISSISESLDVDHSSVEISKTSLISDHTPLAHQHPEDSVAISSVSEAFVYDEDQSGESIQSYIASLNQCISTSSVTAGLVEMTLTPTSSQITTEAPAVFVDSVTRNKATIEEMKLESLINHLRKSVRQDLSSADLNPHYKKLLDALVTIAFEESYSLHEEFDLFTRKRKIVLLSFVLGILAVSAGFFLFSGDQISYYGPPPT